MRIIKFIICYHRCFCWNLIIFSLFSIALMQQLLILLLDINFINIFNLLIIWCHRMRLLILKSANCRYLYIRLIKLISYWAILFWKYLSLLLLPALTHWVFACFLKIMDFCFFIKFLSISKLHVISTLYSWINWRSSLRLCHWWSHN